MIIFENIQLSLVSASALALLISLFISFLLIKTNTNFKFGSQDQKRLTSLNIIPLGGVAMALSFFIAVRFLGEAGSNFIYISFFALAIAFMGVIDDLINLNEYKRRQVPLGIKISARNFGKDRRYPITNFWKNNI